MKKLSQTAKSRVGELLLARRYCAERGDVGLLQLINRELAQIAARYKLDYYSL
jgi:hypothetical protein